MTPACFPDRLFKILRVVFDDGLSNVLMAKGRELAERKKTFPSFSIEVTTKVSEEISITGSLGYLVGAGVGSPDGSGLGASDGDRLGTLEGGEEGMLVGYLDGISLGRAEGMADGNLDGETLGTSEGMKLGEVVTKVRSLSQTKSEFSVTWPTSRSDP